jgi:hypothetical protein
MGLKAAKKQKRVNSIPNFHDHTIRLFRMFLGEFDKKYYLGFHSRDRIRNCIVRKI